MASYQKAGGMQILAQYSRKEITILPQTIAQCRLPVFVVAFDTVPHKELLHKLKHYGIDGKINKWIGSFLTQRKQQVVIEGESSDSCSVDSGVPPGMVLGTLLFCVI